MAQNAIPNNVQNQDDENIVVDQNNDIEIYPEWGVWPPPPPQEPPMLYNFQEWLASEGLQVNHGIVPPNNDQDSPAAAWNDAISMSTSSGSSATVSESYVLVPLNLMNQFWPQEATTSVLFEPASSQVPPTDIALPSNSLDISLTVSGAGLHVGLITHGNFTPAMLLRDCIPMTRLNSYLTTAVIPIFASFGPWNGHYGFK